MPLVCHILAREDQYGWTPTYSFKKAFYDGTTLLQVLIECPDRVILQFCFEHDIVAISIGEVGRPNALPDILSEELQK